MITFLINSTVFKAKPRDHTMISPYFVRSGNISLNNGSLRDSGLIGYDWSRTSVAYYSATSANSYWFDFNASESRPSYGPYSRWYGFPVRCLV